MPQNIVVRWCLPTRDDSLPNAIQNYRYGGMWSSQSKTAQSLKNTADDRNQLAAMSTEASVGVPPNDAQASRDLSRYRVVIMSYWILMCLFSSTKCQSRMSTCIGKHRIYCYIHFIALHCCWSYVERFWKNKRYAISRSAPQLNDTRQQSNHLLLLQTLGALAL